jgi:hypothetical protein
MRRFIVCVHDATPAFSRETAEIVRGLAPLIGRVVSFGVVPDWHGDWPLRAHRDYCDLLREGSEELLLHGYSHRRRRGGGPIAWLTGRSDEMNALDPAETLRLVEQGQQVLADVFGSPARGFLAPAWQTGHVEPAPPHAGIEHVLGFFSLESRAHRSVPLATASWDCGRWRWLGHLGDGIGALLRADARRTPVLAVHPRDIERGYWPGILRLTRELIRRGYEPRTAAGLLAETHGSASA